MASGLGGRQCADCTTHNIHMSRLVILGATGCLAGHEVTVVIRTPSKLPPDVRERVSVYEGDLAADVSVDFVRGQDALINCAGHVNDGEAFVQLVERVVTRVDAHPAAEQPVSWFLTRTRLRSSWPPGRGHAIPTSRRLGAAGRDARRQTVGAKITNRRRSCRRSENAE